MSLNFKSIAGRSLAAALLTSISLSAMPSYAGKRDTAPIRYGSSQSSVQMAAVTPSSTARLTDAFYYPDEQVPASLSRKARDLPRMAANAASNGYDLPIVDPVDYQSYVKIGNSYTIGDKDYHPAEDPTYHETGIASWYGPAFHGNATANGETFDMNAYTAAHPTLPLPSFVEVTNLENNKAIIVRVNDRGPFAKNRIIDLSRAAADKIDMIQAGSAQVSVRYIGPAPRDGDMQYAAANKPGWASDVGKVAYEPKSQPQPSTIALDDHFLQMGSFKDRKNADSLKATLRGVDSSAEVVYARVNGSAYYRVVLGPFASKSDAEVTKSSMSRRGYDGFVVQNP
ncbi:MAG: septal ring lytic transglycosylase RlpA family lipoprotein [Ponticaulis sp.]|nr:septal ring lytic transglycosylase RlpA family lipoprotein [Ponticaulis sp.]